MAKRKTPQKYINKSIYMYVIIIFLSALSSCSSVNVKDKDSFLVGAQGYIDIDLARRYGQPLSRVHGNARNSKEEGLLAMRLRLMGAYSYRFIDGKTTTILHDYPLSYQSDSKAKGRMQRVQFEMQPGLALGDDYFFVATIIGVEGLFLDIDLKERMLASPGIRSDKGRFYFGVNVEGTFKHIFAPFTRWTASYEDSNSFYSLQAGALLHAPQEWSWVAETYLLLGYQWDDGSIRTHGPGEEFNIYLRGPTVSIGYRW